VTIYCPSLSSCRQVACQLGVTLHVTLQTGYDLKTAPRELLEEDLQIVREHILPKLDVLQAEPS